MEGRPALAYTQVLWTVGAFRCALLVRHRPTAFALQMLAGERVIYSLPVESRTPAVAIADDLRQRVSAWTEPPRSRATTE